MGNPRRLTELVTAAVVAVCFATAAAGDDTTPRPTVAVVAPALDLAALGGAVEAVDGGVAAGDEASLRLIASRDPRALGALSIGAPDAGLLLNPMPFPAGPFWKLREPDEAWATDETIDFIVSAIEAVEARYPGSPRLVIGDLSHADGGRIDKHRSHQAGRDADIGFYYRAGEADAFRAARARDLDLGRTWALVRALVTETDVERIFVDRSLVRALHDQAVAEGEDRGWLADIFGRTGEKGIIQHERRHKDHLHARFYNRRAQELGRIAYPVLVESGVAPPPLVRHRARSGETLGSIARRYGTSVTAIRRANGLKTSRIRAGRSYTIPIRRAPEDAGPVVVPPRRLPPLASARLLTTD
jgi:penicillin-insensitive murein endopeptidase